MQRLSITLLILTLSFAQSARASVYLDNFDSYANGDNLSSHGYTCNTIGYGNACKVSNSKYHSPLNSATHEGTLVPTASFNFASSTTGSFSMDILLDTATQNYAISVSSPSERFSLDYNFVYNNAVIGFSGCFWDSQDITSYDNQWANARYDWSINSSTHKITLTPFFNGIPLETKTCSISSSVSSFSRASFATNYVPAGKIYFDNFSVYTGDDTPPLDSTYISTVIPYDGALVATGTPMALEAIGYISANDFEPSFVDTLDGLSVSWSFEGMANLCIDALCALESTAIYSYREPIYTVYNGGQSFDESTTSASLSKDGIYTLTTRLEKPSTFLGFSGFFDLFSFGYDILAEKVTHFTAGTTTPLTQMLYDTGQTTITATTTQAYLDSCLPLPTYWNLNNCVTVLFVPTTRPNYQSSFSGISSRVPFGYFTAIANLLQGATTTTASTTPTGIQVVATILSPLRTGLSLVIYFALGWWIFHRVRKFDFQA